MLRRIVVVLGLVFAGAAWLVPAHAVDNRQVAATSTTAVGVTTTTLVVLPTTVASTGVFSAPLFGAGLVLVGLGLSFRGKRADGSHYAG